MKLNKSQKWAIVIVGITVSFLVLSCAMCGLVSLLDGDAASDADTREVDKIDVGEESDAAGEDDEIEADVGSENEEQSDKQEDEIETDDQSYEGRAFKVDGDLMKSRGEETIWMYDSYEIEEAWTLYTLQPEEEVKLLSYKAGNESCRVEKRFNSYSPPVDGWIRCSYLRDFPKDIEEFGDLDWP